MFFMKQNTLAKPNVMKLQNTLVIRKSIFVSLALPSPIFAHEKRSKFVLSKWSASND